MSGAHRIGPEVPHKALREIDGDYFSVCRWCDEPIRKQDGAPNRRRNWHPACVEVYLLRRSARATRMYVFRRDHGVCANCGADTAKEAREREAERAAKYDRVPSEYAGLSAEWQADHIVPLIDGGSFDLANLQTLCTPCHKAKTAREAGERAARKRPPVPPSPQIGLFDNPPITAMAAG